MKSHSDARKADAVQKQKQKQCTSGPTVFHVLTSHIIYFVPPY